MAHLHSYDSDVSFFNIDNHAKNPNASGFESLRELVTYLAKPLSADKKHRDLLLARAILVWLGQSGSKTPLPRAFCQICKEAGIESEIVAGEVKDVSYLVGDDTIKSGEWPIFKVNEKWHVVMPAFAVSCLMGYEPGGEIAIESDGVTDVQVQEGRQGTMTFRFNEFWFCTNPKYFATICRAENLQKQLIPRALSQEEYLGIPELDEGFFKARLQCLTENSCRLKTKDGKCLIVLLSENPQAKLLEFSYKFSMVGDDTEGLKDLSRLVMYYPNFARKEFTFEIRFPKVGAYILRIYVPDLQTDERNPCCNFRIECTEVNTNFGKLPISTGIEGWGFGTRAKDAGLLRPSNPKPKIAIQFPKNTNETEEVAIQIEKITFKLDVDTMEEMVYESFICGSDDVEEDDLKTETIVDKDNRLLEIISTIKGQGEYGLVVKAKDKNSYTEYESIVNYLLTTFEDKSEIEDADHALANRRKEVVQEGKRSIREERKSKLAKEMNVLEIELNALEKSSKLHNSVMEKENNEPNDNNNDDVTEDETVISDDQRKIEKYGGAGYVKDEEMENRVKSTYGATESIFSTVVEVDIRKTEQQLLLERNSIKEKTEDTIPITEACTTSENGIDAAEDGTRQSILQTSQSRNDEVEDKLNTEKHEADEGQYITNNSTSDRHDDPETFNEGNIIEKSDDTYLNKDELKEENAAIHKRQEHINPYQENVDEHNDPRITEENTDDNNDDQINRPAVQNDDNDNIQIPHTLVQQDEAGQNQEVNNIDQEIPAIEQRVDESYNTDPFNEEQHIRPTNDQVIHSQDQHDVKSNNPNIKEKTKTDTYQNPEEQHDRGENNQDKCTRKTRDEGENIQDKVIHTDNKDDTHFNLH